MYRQTRTKVVHALIVVLCLAGILGGVGWMNIHPAHAASAIPQENNGLALTPFMGWSTWYYIGNSPTETNVLQQAQALKNSGLAAAGYNYVLLDDFWYLNPQTTVDANGYWAPDTNKFPGGLAALAAQVHAMGLKFGAYLTPGVPVAAVNQRKPIVGTSYTADQIANTSAKEINYNYGNTSYYIDYSKPGAQAYINGWAKELASWGVDFLKMDGVGTNDIPDIQAWSSALKNSGRDIVFDLSNSLPISNASTWQANANAWRTQGDVECYGCGTLVSWNNVASRFSNAAAWAQYAGPGGWNDLDAMDVADGTKDGITNTERQTYMSLWAMANAPMYLGDDLTTMDSYGKSLLTNSSVIAVDQSGHPAHPVSQASNQQVWFANLGNGSYNVALFNLGSSTATVSASWSSLGFSGSADVRDLWSQSDLGTFSGSFSASVPSHGSRLLKVTPGGVTPTPTPTQGTTPTPTPTQGTTPTPTPTQGTTPTPTPTPTSTPVSGASCSVHYAITNQWQGGFGASLTITNTGSTAINGWSLKFSFPNGQTITQLWNGTVTQSGSAVTVTNASYNGSIPAGQSLSSEPGFNGTWNGTNSPPTAFTLNGSSCSVV